MKLKEENLYEFWNNFNYVGDIDLSGFCCYSGRMIGKVIFENFLNLKKVIDIYIEDD